MPRWLITDTSEDVIEADTEREAVAIWRDLGTSAPVDSRTICGEEEQ